MPWKITGEKVMPKGDNPLGNRFYGYRLLQLLLPGGNPATYHGLVVSDCVHIVALEQDLTTYLVRQRRPNVTPVGGTEIPETLEFPGGFADMENLEASASAELQQEIGKRASSLVQVGTLYPSVGVSNEQDHVFMGTGLEEVPRGDIVEATEADMRIVDGKFGDFYDQMRRQSVPVSAQTLAAMALVADRL